jgi:hypothetical protein
MDIDSELAHIHAALVALADLPTKMRPGALDFWIRQVAKRTGATVDPTRPHVLVFAAGVERVVRGPRDLLWIVELPAE